MGQIPVNLNPTSVFSKLVLHLNIRAIMVGLESRELSWKMKIESSTGFCCAELTSHFTFKMSRCAGYAKIMLTEIVRCIGGQTQPLGTRD